MVKAIFFDVGNVLVKEGFFAGIKKYEKSHNIKNGELYKTMHDFSYWKDFTLGIITEKEYFMRVRNNFGKPLDIAELQSNIFNNSISNNNLIKYIKTLKNNYLVGVISNNPREWFEFFIQKFGMENLFDVKAVSGYLHIRKPAREIFDYALKQAKVAGNESIYIDDRPDRVEGAESAGIKIIIYKNLKVLKKDLCHSK